MSSDHHGSSTTQLNNKETLTPKQQGGAPPPIPPRPAKKVQIASGTAATGPTKPPLIKAPASSSAAFLAAEAAAKAEEVRRRQAQATAPQQATVDPGVRSRLSGLRKEDAEAYLTWLANVQTYQRVGGRPVTNGVAEFDKHFAPKIVQGQVAAAKKHNAKVAKKAAASAGIPGEAPCINWLRDGTCRRKECKFSHEAADSKDLNLRCSKCHRDVSVDAETYVTAITTKSDTVCSRCPAVASAIKTGTGPSGVEGLSAAEAIAAIETDEDFSVTGGGGLPDADAYDASLYRPRDEPEAVASDGVAAPAAVGGVPEAPALVATTFAAPTVLGRSEGCAVGTAAFNVAATGSLCRVFPCHDPTCPREHAPRHAMPVAVPLLDSENMDGMCFRKNANLYSGNPNNAHLRNIEVLAGAYETYLVPRLRNVGLGLASTALSSGAAGSSKILGLPLHVWVDANEHVRVRLIKHVVDSARCHLRYADRHPNLQQFYVAAEYVVRVTNNLRISAEETDLHKHYATLVAYYDVEHLSDVARLEQQAWDVGRAVDVLRSCDWRIAGAASVFAAVCGAYITQLGRNRRLEKLLLARLPAIAPGSLRDFTDGMQDIYDAYIHDTTGQEHHGTEITDVFWKPLGPGDERGIALQFVSTCILTPVSEEMLKHAPKYGWIATYAIASMEAVCSHFMAVNNPGLNYDAVMAARGRCVLMHLATYLMPLRYAIPAHMLWNIAALCSSAAAAPIVAGSLPGALAALPAVIGVANAAVQVYQARDKYAEDAAKLVELVSGGRRGDIIVGSDSALHNAKRLKRRGGYPRPTVFVLGDRMVPLQTKPQKPGTKLIQKLTSAIEASDIDLRPLKPHEACRIPLGKRGVGDPLRGVAGVQYGPIVQDCRPAVPAHSAENNIAMAANRIVRETPLGDFAAMADHSAFVAELHDGIFAYPNGAPVGQIAATPREEFLRRVGSAPVLVAAFRRAYIWLDKEGIDHNTKLTKAMMRKIAKYHKGFMKREGLLLFGVGGLLDKSGRPITPFHIIFTCLFGPWAMAFNGVLAKVFNKKCFASMLSGQFRNEDVGEAMDACFRRGWHLIEDDVGAWDVSCDNQVFPEQHMEVNTLKRLGCPRAAVCLLVEDCITIIVTEWFVVIKPDGQRNSGSFVTFSGNTCRNITVHVYIIARGNPQLGTIRDNTLDVVTRWRSMGEVTRIVGAGDDDAIGLKPDCVVDLKTAMAEQGFDAEALYRSDISELGFCSGVMMHDSNGCRLTPKIGRMMAKFGTFVDPPRDVDREQLLKGKALSLLPGVGHVPFARSFLTSVITKCGDVKAVMPKHHEHSRSAAAASRGEGQPTFRTIEQFYHRYPEMKYFAEDWDAYFAGLDINATIKHPAIIAMVERDSDGPKDAAMASAEVTLPVTVPKWDFPLLDERANNWTADKFPAFTADTPWITSIFDQAIPKTYADKRGGWRRDLTMEGIEPNPGPTAAALYVVSAALGTIAAASYTLSRSVGPADTVGYYIKSQAGTRSADATVRDGKVRMGQIYAFAAGVVGLPADVWYLKTAGRQVLRHEHIAIVEGQTFEVCGRGLLGGGGKGGGAKNAKAAKSSKKTMVIHTAKKKGTQRQSTPRVAASSLNATAAPRARGTLENVGSALGSLIGASGIGAGAGRLLDSVISGSGTYRAKRESDALAALHPLHGSREAYHNKAHSIITGVPGFAATTEGQLVSHTEFVSPVTGSVGFTVQDTHVISPNVTSSLMPWVAPTASSYQFWRVRGMILFYRGTSSTYSANGALGTVMIGTQYDVDDPVFGDERSLMDAEFSSSGVPCSSFVHMIECAPNTTPFKWLETRHKADLLSSDRASDFGRVVVATQGQPSVYTVGEIIVTYVLEFAKQQYPLFSPILSAQSHLPRITGNIGSFVAAPFGSGEVWSVGTGADSTIGEMHNMSVRVTGVPGADVKGYNAALAIDFVGWPVGVYRVRLEMYMQPGSTLMLDGYYAANAVLGIHTPTTTGNVAIVTKISGGGKAMVAATSNVGVSTASTGNYDNAEVYSTKQVIAITKASRQVGVNQLAYIHSGLIAHNSTGTGTFYMTPYVSVTRIPPVSGFGAPTLKVDPMVARISELERRLAGVDVDICGEPKPVDAPPNGPGYPDGGPAPLSAQPQPPEVFRAVAGESVADVLRRFSASPLAAACASPVVTGNALPITHPTTLTTV